MFIAIKNFFTAPIYERDVEKTQDARTTHRVAVVLLGLGALSLPFIFLLASPIKEYALYGTGGGVFIWLFTINLVKRERTTIAKIIILTVNTINLFAVIYGTGGLDRPVIITTFFLMALATLLFPNRGAMVYGAIILALSTVLFFAGRIDLIPSPSIPGDDRNLYFIFIFTVVAVTAILAILSVNTQRNIEQIRKSEEELKERYAELSEIKDELEIRVEERTAELQTSAEQLERRATQFEAIAQLARTITSIQDVNTLLPRITQLVSQNFDFYHVGLFLLDESRQYAMLSAANSEGGQRMLARKHRLGVGQTGIVGYVTATGNPRIALDTGTDAVYFDNPDLPDTRSEMALPLRVGGTIMGALDVQSTVPNAFSEDDVEVLSILADEVSIAIENARLYEESQRVLEDAQSAFGEFTQEAWKKMAQTRKLVGYELSGTTVRSLDKPIQNGNQAIAVPIKLRGQVIGTMNISLPENKRLNQDEIDITKALAERVGVAIESATLLEETQRRAVRESLIGDISAKLSATAEIERLMQVAVEELRGVLGASEVSLEISPEE